MKVIVNFFKKIISKFANMDFVGNSKKFIVASISFILAGLIVLLVFGFNLGIDFTGGTVLRIQVGEDLNNQTIYDEYVEKVELVLDNNNLEIGLVQTEGEGIDLSLLFRYQDVDGINNEDMIALNEIIRQEIASELNIDENKITNSQRIGPSASAALMINALLAVLIATALILAYVAIRFELLSGVAAIIALIHDVLIMSAFVLIFQLQINSAFIAALITIIGYSINDTIVVLDRVRENKSKESYAKKSTKDLANISIKETLVRTLNTSFTTIFTIAMIVIISVPSIREFAIPILFGVLAGTYSSIFIAAPSWVWLYDKLGKEKVIIKNKNELEV